MITRLARYPRRVISAVCLISTLSTMGFISVNEEALNKLPFDVTEVKSSINDYAKDFASNINAGEVMNGLLEIVDRVSKTLDS